MNHNTENLIRITLTPINYSNNEIPLTVFSLHVTWRARQSVLNYFAVINFQNINKDIRNGIMISSHNQKPKHLHVNPWLKHSGLGIYALKWLCIIFNVFFSIYNGQTAWGIYELYGKWTMHKKNGTIQSKRKQKQKINLSTIHVFHSVSQRLRWNVWELLLFIIWTCAVRHRIEFKENAADEWCLVKRMRRHNDFPTW